MENIEVIKYRGHQIEVCYDEDILNPRKEYDHCSTMLCFHKHYDLGDKDNLPNISPNDFNGWDEIEEHLYKKEGAVIVLPLSLYDHSGISIFVGRVSDWDYGQVGFIYATRAQILKWYGCKRLSKKILALAKTGLLAEVKTYDQYLTGEVYEYVITGPDCDDSCSGFFNQNDMINEAKSCIDHSIRKISLPLVEAHV